LPSGQISGLLLQLELKGLVSQSPGKRFSLTPVIIKKLGGVRPEIGKFGEIRLIKNLYNKEVSRE
jgi:hypothetical protein